MKTIQKSSLLVSLITAYALNLMLSSCSHHDELDNLVPKKKGFHIPIHPIIPQVISEGGQGSPEPAKQLDEYIIQFKLGDKAKFKIILEELRQKPVIVHTCDCDSELVLLQFPPHLNPEERRQLAEDAIQHEDLIVGELYNNMEIRLNSGVGTYYNNDLPSDSPSNPDVLVAVIDGGIDKSNLYVQNYIWENPGSSCQDFNSRHGNDFTRKYNYEDTLYLHPHGTLVSSIVVTALPPNMNLRLMDLRVFDRNGNGTLFDAICAMQYAIENEADIINMSWGYYRDSVNPLLHTYMEKAMDKNIVIITSAGNNASNTDDKLHFPSHFNSRMKNVIAVASLNESSNGLASYSNYGIQSVAIAAKGFHSFLIRNKIVSAIGTSYAAPMVTREAALLLYQQPELKSNEVVSQIMSSAEYLGIPVMSRGKLKESHINF